MMPESEIFKIAMQTGLFGIVTYGVIWALRTGWPEIRDMVKNLAEKHEATEKLNAEKHEATEKLLASKIETAVTKLAEEQRQALNSLGDRHERAVVTLVAEQTSLVKQLDKNCREERLGMAGMIAKTMPAPG